MFLNYISAYPGPTIIMSCHNEYLGENHINPEADPNKSTDHGDDPLIYDQDKQNRIYL